MPLGTLRQAVAIYLFVVFLLFIVLPFWLGLSFDVVRLNPGQVKVKIDCDCN